MREIKMKKEILTNECLTSARTLYRKLKHLHQVHWTLGRVYNKNPINGVRSWHIIVTVPCRDTMYIWYKETNQLQLISIADENDVATYQDCDFKLFIKIIKKILRGKEF